MPAIRVVPAGLISNARESNGMYKFVHRIRISDEIRERIDEGHESQHLRCWLVKVLVNAVIWQKDARVISQTLHVMGQRDAVKDVVSSDDLQHRMPSRKSFDPERYTGERRRVDRRETVSTYHQNKPT